MLVAVTLDPGSLGWLCYDRQCADRVRTGGDRVVNNGHDHIACSSWVNWSVS